MPVPAASAILYVFHAVDADDLSAVRRNESAEFRPSRVSSRGVCAKTTASSARKLKFQARMSR